VNSGDQEREAADFLKSATQNLRKLLEHDPEISAAQIETIVMQLPQVLREAAPLLARSDDADWRSDGKMRECHAFEATLTHQICRTPFRGTNR
jgi:hypothetical protein